MTEEGNLYCIKDSTAPAETGHQRNQAVDGNFS